MGGLGREEMEKHPLWGLGGHFHFLGWGGGCMDPVSLLLGVLSHAVPWSCPPKVQGITVSASPLLYLGHLRLHGFKRMSKDAILYECLRV